MTADSGHRLDLRLVPGALTAWAVTGSGILWQFAGAVIAAGTAVMATAAGGWWLGVRARRCDMRAVVTAALAVTGVGLGFTVAITLRVAEVRHHPVAEFYGRTATVVVSPTESPHLRGSARVMFQASLRALDDNEMSGRVAVFASAADFAELTVGRPAAFRAHIGRPTRRDLSVAVLSSMGRPKLGEAPLIQRAAQRIRSGFAEASRAVLPAEQAAMLPAVVLGDTSGLPTTAVADFRASGLTHLTAVSGANVTIVCGAVLLTGALIGPRLALILAATTLLGFVIVVQPSASVLRAAVMGAITLLAVASSRRRQALPALSASVIVLMVGVPELAVDVGFALSVSATAALVLIAPVWSKRLVDRSWPKPLADAVSVAVAAQLVTAPLVAGISGSFSVVSVVANMAAAPVVAPVTVIGTGAAALQPLWPAAAELLIRFTGPELWWLSEVARHAADLPGAVLTVPAGLPGVIAVAASGIGAVAAWRWRWIRVATCAGVVCLLAWTIAGMSGGHGTIVR